MTVYPSLVNGARLKIVCFTLRGIEARRCHIGRKSISLHSKARLAQLVERKTFNLVVVGSSPTAGIVLIGQREEKYLSI